MSSSLRKVIVQALPALDGRVFDYSSKDDFKRLWGFGDIPRGPIIIVWSDTATDSEIEPINTGEFLSPVDWAACCVARLENPADWPEILILDINSGLHNTIPSVVRLNTLRSERIPWLRYQHNMNLAEIMEWVAASRLPKGDRCKDGLKQFLRDIRLNLTEANSGERYSRHAVANIVGPMILLGRPVRDSIHLNALQRLLECCEISQPYSPDIITPPAKGVGVDPIPATGGEKNLAGKSGHELSQASGQQVDKVDTHVYDAADVGVFLLDDLEHWGWSDWVKDCLPGISPVAHHGPGELVKAVENQMSVANSTDLRFRLKLPGVDQPKPVLLLDRRLFCGNFKGEKAFYKDALLPLIVARFLAGKKDLAWPGFDNEDKSFAEASRAVNDGSLEYDSREHQEALTWLPRVLALADCSLPIVLFSSTDSKASIAPLLPYKNICVSFQKPSLSALRDVSLRDATRTRFLEAIKGAVAYAELRKKCQFIQKLAKTVEFKAKDENKDHKIYVELYLDESGNPDSPEFCVGGVFGVFQSLAAADAFDDVCVANGLRYFKNTLFDPKTPAPLAKRGDSGESQLKLALDQFRAANIDEVAIGYVNLRSGDAASGNHEDERLYELVAALVELFCAESVPAIARQYGTLIENISLSVYLGTRVVPSTKKGQFTYRGYIDIQVMPNMAIRLRSMAGRDAFPIVRRAKFQHAPLDKMVVERAIAVCLPYETDEIGNKSDFDRVIDRISKLVYKFDHNAHTESAATAPKDGDRVVGRVTGRKPINSTAADQLWVEVPGERGGVPCYKNDCDISIDQIGDGSFVQLTFKKTENGRKGVYVNVLDKETDYSGAFDRKVSSQFLSDKTDSILRPDYRALHYISDQVLPNKINGFTSCIPPFSTKPGNANGVVGQFEDNFDSAMKSDILASRALDAKLLSDALAIFAAANIERVTARPKARAMVASRLWEELNTCKGDVLAGAFPIHVSAATQPLAVAAATQAAVSRGRAAERAQPPARSKPVNPQLAEYQRKWLIKRFKPAANYKEEWYAVAGFCVQTVKQGENIIVFAELAQVEKVLWQSLPGQGFVPPDATNLFDDQTGRPCKTPYTPPPK